MVETLEQLKRLRLVKNNPSHIRQIDVLIKKIGGNMNQGSVQAACRRHKRQQKHNDARMDASSNSRNSRRKHEDIVARWGHQHCPRVRRVLIRPNAKQIAADAIREAEKTAKQRKANRESAFQSVA